MGIKSLWPQNYENHRDAVLYCLLFSSFILVNKYVLWSVGFRFAAVLQGCHTLLCSVYLLCSIQQLPAYTSSSRSALVVDALLYVSSLVTGSKALAALPVGVVLSVQNVPVLWQHCLLRLPYSYSWGLQRLAAVTGLLSSLALLLVPHPQVSEGEMLWLRCHCVCVMMLDVSTQIPDSRPGQLTHNLYRNLLSCSGLWVWTIVSEEGRLAAGFTPVSEDAWLVSGCIAGAVLYSLLQGSYRQSRYGAVPVLSRLGAVLLSLYLQQQQMSLSACSLVALSIMSSLLLSLPPSRLHGNQEPALPLIV